MGNSNRNTVYSFQNVQVSVNNVGVRGFFEGDDAVMIEDNSDMSTLLVGADGDSTVSYTADTAKKITLKLQPNSPTNAFLRNLHRRALAGSLTDGFPISVRDTSNGEGGASASAHIATGPSAEFGTNVAVREWTIWATNWNDNKINYQRP